MYKVIKRDGKIVEFSIDKIADAIEKAFKACSKKYHKSIINMLALNVTSNFERKVTDDKIQVEDIQDSVEEVLSNAGYGDVAKAYIIYRKQREKIRNMNSTMLDYKEIVNSYVNLNDWPYKEKNESSYSIGGLILSNNAAITANYWLTEVYDNEIANAHLNGDIYIHDLSMLTGFSAGWSLKELLVKGIVGAHGNVSTRPAKHLNILCQQIVDFIGIMQSEWSGPQTISSFDTYLAPFIKADNLTYDDVKMAIESFVYGINIPSCWGTKTPLVNIILDVDVPDNLADLDCIVGGKKQDFKYKECKLEMDLINKAFLEVMLNGDGEGKRFEYPIPIYSISEKYDWSDNENNRLLFELASKYGTPYFCNYTNIEHGIKEIDDMHQRGKENANHLNNICNYVDGRMNGSIGLVTINLPRLVYGSKDEEEFYEKLDRIIDISVRSLNVKREVITKLLDGGLYPYTKEYLGSFDNHCSSIGVVGINETCLNAQWLKRDLRHKESRYFAEDILKHIKKKILEYQDEYCISFNLEAVSDENVTYHLAKQDLEKYHNILVTKHCDNIHRYTNCIYLSIDETKDLFDSLDIQSELHNLNYAGNIFHVFLKDNFPNYNSTKLLVHKMVENYHIPYFTISPVYSICKEHGYIKGETFECPICKQKTKVYIRVLDRYCSLKDVE